LSARLNSPDASHGRRNVGDGDEVGTKSNRQGGPATDGGSPKNWYSGRLSVPAMALDKEANGKKNKVAY